MLVMEVKDDVVEVEVFEEILVDLEDMFEVVEESVEELMDELDEVV